MPDTPRRINPKTHIMRTVTEVLHREHIAGHPDGYAVVVTALHETLGVPRTPDCPVGCLLLNDGAALLLNRFHDDARTIGDVVRLVNTGGLSPRIGPRLDDIPAALAAHGFTAPVPKRRDENP